MALMGSLSRVCFLFTVPPSLSLDVPTFQPVAANTSVALDQWMPLFNPSPGYPLFSDYETMWNTVSPRQRHMPLAGLTAHLSTVAGALCGWPCGEL